MIIIVFAYIIKFCMTFSYLMAELVTIVVTWGNDKKYMLHFFLKENLLVTM